MAFQTALQFWKEFNILDLQRQLDGEAAEVARRQDESDASVKRLVDLSREFKRSTTEEVRKKVSPLLKAFQSEIDSLTKRSTAAETTFLNAYKKVIEIPDPIPLLEQALTHQSRLMSLSDLEVENIKLRETLDEYNKEFAHVKNQEATITKLRTQIKELENSTEQRATSKAGEIKSRLLETYNEKEKDLRRSLLESNKSKEDALTQVTILQSALESTQSELFELKNKHEEVTSARSAEMDMLANDLERANQRALTSEKQVETMNKLMEQQNSMSPDKRMSIDTTELELELKAKEKEVTCLLEDVKRLQNSFSQLKDSSSKHITLLETQLNEKICLVSQLENKLSIQKDYEEMKKELEIMKSVEFSTSHHESTMITGSTKPLEVLLLEKNRALVNENTGLKTELSELQDHFSSVQKEYKNSLQTIQDQSNLIGHLEGDLTRIQPFLPQRTEGEGQASPSDIISEVVNNINSEQSGLSTNESLLNIVTKQRERFKQKNAELEVENQHQKQTVLVLQREVDTLRGDNVKLYEKIRFLQTYQGNSKSGSDSTVRQYSSQYEAKLDPFSAFSAKERQRKYMQLSGPDKATLLLGRFILSNKLARMAAFCYIIILHIIVMMVLAKLAYTTDTQTIDLYSECAKKFTQHMQAFHPQNVEGVIESFHDHEKG